MDIYQLVLIIRDLEKTQLECIIYKVTLDVTLVIKCIENSMQNFTFIADSVGDPIRSLEM